MKIHLLSDLHLETGDYELPADMACDVVVAAGDIAPGVAGVDFLKRIDKPVVYVLGNHEYWPCLKKDEPADYAVTLQAIRDAARGSNVHVLEGDSVVIDGTRFIGGTLWTNFGEGHRELMTLAGWRMRDYQLIDAAQWYEQPGNVQAL